MESLVDDLAYLRAPIEVSARNRSSKAYGAAETEDRKRQLQQLDRCFGRLKGETVEVRPNWFLLVDTKGKRPRHRLIPMNSPVRAALQK
jgi:hypothetical protein